MTESLQHLRNWRDPRRWRTVTLVALLPQAFFFLLCAPALADVAACNKAVYAKAYATALKECVPLAKKGIIGAQNVLGTMYENGQGVPQNYKEAARWYRLAADQGDGPAQSNLGTLYFTGRGVPQDFREAMRWFRLAADQGRALAQWSLGTMYRTGEGAPQDYAEAMRWFRLAADQGDAQAQFNLGYIYAKGEGVPQDYKEAAEWYRLAADQGDGPSQSNLAIMYYKGQGVPQDYVRAHMWFNLASASGDADSVELSDLLASQMTPQQVAEAQRLAQQWNANAQKALAAKRASAHITPSGTLFLEIIDGTSVENQHHSETFHPGTTSTDCVVLGDIIHCQSTSTPGRTMQLDTSTLYVQEVGVADGIRYTLSCTANWVGSNCGPLERGMYETEIKGTTAYLTAFKGGNMGKRITIKFRLLDIRAIER
jgi:TPR repeat protein